MVLGSTALGKWSTSSKLVEIAEHGLRTSLTSGIKGFLGSGFCLFLELSLLILLKWYTIIKQNYFLSARQAMLSLSLFTPILPSAFNTFHLLHLGKSYWSFGFSWCATSSRKPPLASPTLYPPLQGFIKSPSCSLGQLQGDLFATEWDSRITTGSVCAIWPLEAGSLSWRKSGPGCNYCVWLIGKQYLSFQDDTFLRDFLCYFEFYAIFTLHANSQGLSLCQI